MRSGVSSVTSKLSCASSAQGAGVAVTLAVLNERKKLALRVRHRALEIVCDDCSETFSEMHPDSPQVFVLPNEAEIAAANRGPLQ